MKPLITLGLAAALAMPAPSLFAADPPAGAGGQTKQEAPGTTDFDKQMAQVQENMRAMQEQMDRIRQTEDPQARQKLLQDHWTTMQNNMQMMHGMWAPGMMGCCDDGPGPYGRPHDGRAHVGGLPASDARATQAAPIHDGAIHADAADDDGSNDAASAVDVAAAAAEVSRPGVVTSVSCPASDRCIPRAGPP